MAAKFSDDSLKYQLETEEGGNQSCMTHIFSSDSPPRYEKWESDKKAVGKGGQGVVVLQTCTSLPAPHKAVRAVKVLSCSEGRQRKRYVREVAAMVRFSQEGRSGFFVKMLGWYLINDDTNICIAMEYMPQGDLHSYLKRRQHPLSESDAQQVIWQVLQGLRIMHKASKSVLASNSSVAVGTYGYMAPELFQKPADGTKLDERKADIWATGAMTFYLMSKDEGFQSWRSLDFLKKTCRGTEVSLYGGPKPTYRRLLSWPIRDQREASSAPSPLLTATGINFIREMTMFEPEHRLRAVKALDHPWLDEVPDHPWLDEAPGHPRPSHPKREQGQRGKKERRSAPPVAPQPLSPSQTNRLSQGPRKTTLTPPKPSSAAEIRIVPKESPHHSIVARQQDPSATKALPAKKRRERSLSSPSSIPKDNQTVQESEACVEVADASSTTHETATTTATTTGDEISWWKLRDAVKQRQADLYLAAQRGQLKDVESLVSSGDGVTFPRLRTERALYAAAAKGHVGIMEYLIGRQPTIAVGVDGVTALLEACEGGHLAAVKVLLDRGADPNMSLAGGYTPLHLAASNGHAELVMLLLNSKARVNQRDSSQLTALHHAANNLNVDAAKVLLEKGAEIGAKALSNGTPLHLARCDTSGAADEMVKLLNEWPKRKGHGVESGSERDSPTGVQIS